MRALITTVVMLCLASTNIFAEASEEKTLEFIGKLLNIQDQKDISNPVQNDVIKRKQARALINNFALEISGRESRVASSGEIKAALLEINTKMHLYAEKQFGKAGENSTEAWDKFFKSTFRNPGLLTLFEMIQQYQ